MRSDLDHGGEEDWRNPIHAVHPVYLTCLANYSMQPNNLMEYVLLHISNAQWRGMNLRSPARVGVVRLPARPAGLKSPCPSLIIARRRSSAPKPHGRRPAWKGRTRCLATGLDRGREGPGLELPGAIDGMATSPA